MNLQLLIAACSALLVSLAWRMSTNPYTPLLVVILFVCIVSALSWPSAFLMLFVIFSVFRIHEVLPVLQPMQIPLLLSELGLASVLWHMFLSRRVKPFLSHELIAMLTFFAIVSLGVFFAKTYDLAYSYWSENYIKLIMITLALAWSMQEPSDFRSATYFITFSGTLIGAMTIWNRVSGTGLVELTRSALAAEFGSPLSDPNVLALTLIFSLSYALSLLLSPTRAGDRTLGIAATAVATAAVICTQSRGGLLAFVAVIGVGVARMLKSRGTILVIVPAVVAGLYFGMDLSQRVSGGDADLTDESANGRLYAWQAAIGMAIDRPLTGVGMNNFANEFYTYTPVWLDRPITAHSIWFQVLGEVGVPGLLVFITIIVLAFRSLIRTDRLLSQRADAREMQGFTSATLLALVGLCVGGSFLSQAYDWILYVILAMSAALSRWAATEVVHDAHQTQSRSSRPANQQLAPPFVRLP
ncbi:O-antigen ligase family protein [Mesorhizobium sp. BAC0120]|uniref:O-antigen ligase family protein n=1 Tax=Mesorhizobium sp. BAC0120 TaxID=3090670 RepID=UPI00298CE02E|nr:O-antigen ligase family protein [Mesorhizobium sp. BAC0120]MDW6023081.1 O-antigen ligase family protein [Mesorhizobium sp. BAC0120]